jgi:hypothetical protein
MKKLVKKAVPFAFAISAPFCLSADDANAEGMLCAAPSKSTLGTTKATTTNGNSNSSSSSMMNGQITPPAGPTVQNGADVFITADFIYWQASGTGLNYAFNGAPLGSVDTTGHMKSPDFTYEPGFKVGLGVLCDHDNWDVYAEYTWLTVSKEDTKSTLNGTTASPVQIIPTWPGIETALVYQTASGEWSLNFNVLDFEIGRNFWISKRITFRPHLGMKFSWMEQHFNIEGFNFDGTTADNQFKMKQTQFGVGVRTGLDTAYYFDSKWAIYGDFGVTGLYNYFKESRHDYTGDTLENTVSQRPQFLTTVVELDLGLRFETIFSKGRYKYLLQAGWETQMWFDQEQFIRFTDHNPGNLSLSGLTIKTGFWF